MNWEYFVYSSKYPMSVELNELGHKGWELVSSVKEGYDWTFIFKRAK